MIHIGSHREVFWDDYLIDTEKTTAVRRLHSPVRRECVLRFDSPWEGDGCNYQNILADDGLYRMYYLGWSMISADRTEHTTNNICVCYAESRDGLHWVKPALGLYEYEGSRENNILLAGDFGSFDNFMVMKDENPACPPEERYKGIGICESLKPGLQCFVSPDGIHFRHGWELTRSGFFDSLNTVLWDAGRAEYIAYIRGFHQNENCGDLWGVRDIRCITSKDFRSWSDPVLLDFGSGEDYPLYTNCISRYPRAPQLFTGFPTRYVERQSWSDNFERLCGRQERLMRMKIHPRYGLAITDCVFMSSRDGLHWDRTEEAFLRPGPEQPRNWVYGDCYPTLGLIETPGFFPGSDNELSMYLNANHWMHVPAELYRYTLRLDGFISRNAGYAPQRLVTKPFVYSGSELRLNFETSARGTLYITLRCADGRSIHTDEIFGDRTDRPVDFADGSPADFEGQPVTMEIRMSDADVYAFRFV